MRYKLNICQVKVVQRELYVYNINNNIQESFCVPSEIQTQTHDSKVLMSDVQYL